MSAYLSLCAHKYVCERVCLCVFGNWLYIKDSCDPALSNTAIKLT